MNRKLALAFAAGALVTGSLAFLIAAAPEHDEHTGMNQPEDGPAAGMDMMAETMRLATPDEHHAELAKTIGNWTAKTSFIMDPNKPPMEGKGTMSVEWVLGGRYTHSSFKMDFMGQPYEGLGYTGYDIAHSKYVGTWMDTMSTKITYMTGNKEKNDALVMHGTATTPMGDSPMKIISTWSDDDTWTDKFYDQTPDGTWIQSSTIVYTRD